MSYGWAAVWLLFFPNSAYLFTDLVHLKKYDGQLFWLDLSILFVSGVYGLLLTLISLRNMEKWYERILPGYLTPLIPVVILIGCGYGIYLGRVERWNSWDVFTDPSGLAHTIANEIRHPLRFQQAWGMAVLFGSILYMFYLLQRQLFNRISK